MKILLLVFALFFGIFIVFKKVIFSAKRNLFKDQVAWSNKEIKIKHNKSKEISESNRDDNYLQIIAEESTEFLEEQYKREEI